MSGSTLDQTRGDQPSAPPDAAAPKPRITGAWWWLASLAFHSVLVTWLLLFSPVRVIDRSASSNSHIGTARAQQIMAKVHESQGESLSASLKHLRDIRTRLGALESRKRDEFKTYAADVLKDAPPQIAEAQSSAAKAQADALVALDSANDRLSKFVRRRATVDFDEGVQFQDAATDHQSEAAKSQERAMARLSLDDGRFVAAVAAQSAAISAQEQAAQAVLDAVTARDRSRNSRDRTPYERQIDHYTYELRRAKEDAANLPAKISKLTQQESAAEAAVAAAQTALDQGSTAIATQPNLPRVNNESLVEARKALQAIGRELADAQQRLKSAPKRITENQNQIDALLAEGNPAPSAPTPEDEQLARRQSKAIELQAAARQAQTKAIEATLAAAKQPPSNRPPGSSALAELENASPVTMPKARDGQEKNIADLYNAAVENEASLAESYRRLRAMELAMDRQIPLNRALRLTEVVKVQRPDLRAKLNVPIQSNQDVSTAKEGLQDARSQVAAMVQLGESLLSEAQGLDHSGGSSIATDRDYSERYAKLQAMEGMATENDAQWAVDLTAAMKNAEGGAGGAGDGVGDGGDGSGGPGGNGGSGRGTGWGFGGRGGGGPGGTGGGGSSFGGGPYGTALANAVTNHLRAWPGRTIAANGTSPGWVYVDSWYILGPFDNTARANIDRKFPPETVVDLNAVYTGKNNIPIRWEFFQAGRPNIMPPLDGYNALHKLPGASPEVSYRRNLEYIIYYAYTELRFEKDCDLWVAVGSDDFSEIWINDLMIWRSGKRPKAWRIDEGMRKVHFKQGVNRILSRVENANDRTEFSLVIWLQPQ